MHSKCLTGDVFGSQRCDCGPQLHARDGADRRGGPGRHRLSRPGRAGHRAAQQAPGLRAAGRRRRHGAGQPAARLRARPAELRHRRADPARPRPLLDPGHDQQPPQARRPRGLRPRDRGAGAARHRSQPARTAATSTSSATSSATSSPTDRARILRAPPRRRACGDPREPLQRAGHRPAARGRARLLPGGRHRATRTSTWSGCRARSSCRWPRRRRAGHRALRLPRGARRRDPGRDAALRIRGRRGGARARRGGGAARRAGRVRRAHDRHAGAGAGSRRRRRGQQGPRGGRGGAQAADVLAPAAGAPMLRPETKSRARALQMLYAWELQRAPADAGDRRPGSRGSPGRSRGCSIGPRRWPTRCGRRGAERSTRRPRARENWRLERMAVVERNILRLGIHELRRGDGAAQGGHRRGGPAGALVRRRAGAGLRQRRARPESPTRSGGCEHPAGQLAGSGESAGGRRRDPPVRDLRPAGGAGHRVRLVCSGWPGCRAARPWSTASRCERAGGRNSFALRRAGRGAAGARARSAPTSWSRTSTSCRCSSPGSPTCRSV